MDLRGSAIGACSRRGEVDPVLVARAVGLREERPLARADAYEIAAARVVEDDDLVAVDDVAARQDVAREAGSRGRRSRAHASEAPGKRARTIAAQPSGSLP